MTNGGGDEYGADRFVRCRYAAEFHGTRYDQRTSQSDPRVSRSPFFRAAQSTGASAGDCGSMRRTARVDGEVRENHEGHTMRVVRVQRG